MGKINKHYNDYQDREVLRSLGTLPITGTLPSTYFIEEDITYETVDPDTIEALIQYETAQDDVEEIEFRKLIKDTLDSLTPREAKILRLRFGVDMETDYTLEEIGKAYSCTKERIRQIEAKALRKMRHPSRSKKLNGEPTTLWDMATESAPERDDKEWGWSAFQEEWYQKQLVAWAERTAEARKKLQNVYKNMRGLV